MTPIALKELKTAKDVRPGCKPPRWFKFRYLTNEKYSIFYGSCYFLLAYDRNSGSILRALLAYNGGQGQVYRLLSNKKRMAYESANYALKIMDRTERCEHWEKKQ